MFSSPKSHSTNISSLKEISSLLNEISMRIFKKEQKLITNNNMSESNKKNLTDRIGYLHMCEYYLRNMDYLLEDLHAQLQTAPADIKKYYKTIARFSDTDKQESIQLFNNKGYFKRDSFSLK